MAELGTTYADGEVIARQGERGDCLYVVQDGEVEVLLEDQGNETIVGVASTGELLGEMAVFSDQLRGATMRARGSARVLTIDKRNFLRRVGEDPTLAFRIVQLMARRIRDLNLRILELSRRLPEIAQEESTSRPRTARRDPASGRGPASSDRTARRRPRPPAVHRG